MFAVALCSTVTAALAQLPVAKIPTADAKGTKDNPLLKRYEGSYIVAYERKSFGELTLPLSPLELVSDKFVKRNNKLHEPKKRTEEEEGS